MSKRAVATAPPLPMGFRYRSDLPVIENARTAWETKKEVHHAQIERNARTLIRRVLPGVDVEEIEFTYDVALFPDTPTFVLDEELVAYNGQRKELALIEVCGGCGKHWQWNHFDGLAGLGRELASRDARDPFLCRLCEAMDRSGSK